MSEIEDTSAADEALKRDLDEGGPDLTPKSGVDEHHGRGGSYLRDPVTGERVLIQRTEACNGCRA